MAGPVHHGSLQIADHEVHGANPELMHLSISEKGEHEDVNAWEVRSGRFVMSFFQMAVVTFGDVIHGRWLPKR